MRVCRQLLQAGTLFALLAAALIAGLALFSVETRAQQTSQDDLYGSVKADRSPAGGPHDAREVEAFFDGLIPGQLREGHVAGATVSVVKDGRMIFAKGYGHADVERREPVVADETLFYPGSAGKLFTWTAVMQLVERGKLDLDADVNTYLDFEIPDTYAGPVTMRHLMTHSAGFEEQFAAELAEDRRDVLPLREFLIRYMPERVYAPGEYFAYSNYGTALAGYVVERVSGEPYERYVEANILKPLGMEHSAAPSRCPPAWTRIFRGGIATRTGPTRPGTSSGSPTRRRRRSMRRPPTWPGSCWRTSRTASTAIRASWRRAPR